MKGLTNHARNDRHNRMVRVQLSRDLNKAEIFAIIDCGNYGTSGRYECHVIYTDATVDIFNEFGFLVTQKLLTEPQLYYNYPKNFYYSTTTDKMGKTLYDYAMEHKMYCSAY